MTLGKYDLGAAEYSQLKILVLWYSIPVKKIAINALHANKVFQLRKHKQANTNFVMLIFQDTNQRLLTEFTVSVF